jgi:ATP-binding cassette subfamily B protein
MEAQSGTIEFDGQNIRSLSQEDLNAQISFVPQKPQFLNRSIYENLKYANPQATKEEIETCMKKAGLYDEIMSKKDGFNARPDTLSGGQQQRLAIAQAFLRSAPIVLMDEPTSAVDRYTGREVLDTILAFGSDKTLIMVSHNPSEIAKADRVVVLAEGKVIEDGRPADLIKKDGYFSGLYREEINLFSASEKKKRKECTENGALFKQKFCSGQGK